METCEACGVVGLGLTKPGEVGCETTGDENARVCTDARACQRRIVAARRKLSVFHVAAEQMRSSASGEESAPKEETCGLRFYCYGGHDRCFCAWRNEDRCPIDGTPKTPRERNG